MEYEWSSCVLGFSLKSVRVDPVWVVTLSRAKRCLDSVLKKLNFEDVKNMERSLVPWPQKAMIGCILIHFANDVHCYFCFLLGNYNLRLHHADTTVNASLIIFYWAVIIFFMLFWQREEKLMVTGRAKHFRTFKKTTPFDTFYYFVFLFWPFDKFTWIYMLFFSSLATKLLFSINENTLCRMQMKS